MPSKTADLCQYDLPNGKLCRQIALKNQQVCRHHSRLFRHDEAQMLHDEAMARLAADLESLPLPRLLCVLHTRLNRIHRAVRGLPEAQLTLETALRRLAEENASRSADARFDQEAARELLETLTKSMTKSMHWDGTSPENQMKSMS